MFKLDQMLRLGALWSSSKFQAAHDFQTEQAERAKSVSEGVNQRPSVQPPEASMSRVGGAPSTRTI